MSGEISFLLGAGFSIEAGIPIRFEINSRFRDLKWDQFMIYSETTTRFLRAPDPNSSWQNVKERMFVEKIISFYNEKSTKDFDYEEFYDYCYKLSNGLNDPEFDSFFDKFQKGKDNYPNRANALAITIRTINYLVNDLLISEDNIFDTGIINPYLPFLNLIRKLEKQFEIINLYTLNHDLLLEHLLETEMTFDYSDGFQINGTPYFLKSKKQQIRIKYFADKYETKVRAVKLHGSIDHYVYNISEPFEMVKIPKNLYPPNLHREVLVEGKWIEENCWTLYEPHFLSGTTTKILNYDQYPFYTSQFSRFKDSLNNSKLLIVVGYGLQDSKINEMIENGINNNGLKVLVVKRTKMPAAFFENSNVAHYGEDLGIADLNFEGVQRFLQ